MPDCRRLLTFFSLYLRPSSALPLPFLLSLSHVSALTVEIRFSWKVEWQKKDGRRCLLFCRSFSLSERTGSFKTRGYAVRVP